MKTTPIFAKPEFWVTAVTSVCGILIAFGVFTPEQADDVVRCASTIIGAVMSLLSSFKFVGVQHAAKVEVFRAMCAMRLDKEGQFKALGAGTPEQQVAAIAKSVGL